ncbi:MAG: hypothetical protein ACXWV6_12325, partial [Chitinophagaceae bacterium]
PLKDLWKWSKPLVRSQQAGVGSRKLVSSPAQDSGLTTLSPGLICLKGGDLAIEIQESNSHPRLMEIKEIFEEEFFKDKFILYIPRSQ